MSNEFGQNKRNEFGQPVFVNPERYCNRVAPGVNESRRFRFSSVAGWFAQIECVAFECDRFIVNRRHAKVIWGARRELRTVLDD